MMPERNFSWDLHKARMVELANSPALLEIDEVRGFMGPGDVNALYKIVASLPASGSYLEVGSWMGLSSTIAVCSAVQHGNLDANIFCVDTWEGSIEHQELEVIKNRALFDVFLDSIRRTGA